MKTLQKLKWFILGGIIFAGVSTYAVSQPSFTPSLIPISDATYYLGSTSPARKWAGIYMSGSDGCLNLTSGLIGSTGVACGSGGGGSFPFTATANYNSTSTVIGFLSGLFSNSTTTLNGMINFPGISNGCLNITSGVVGSTACGAGAAFPFTNFANYNATTTVIGFSNGLFSTASSTFNNSVYFSNLTQGLGFIGSNGFLSTVSTSTLTASSPLTGSFVQIGSGGSLGCTTAASGVAGCLSNTAFDTFNNKQNAITVSFPIQITGSALSFVGLSTSSPAVTGNIPYFSGVNTFANVATGTITCTGNATCGGGSYVIGSNLTVASPFSFTANANYNATGTVIGFSGGLFSTASSTFNNDVFFSNLTGGFAGITTNGRLYSFATSTIKGSQINNDSGWTSNVGTVTGITNGTGLVNNGTTYTVSGTITAGVGTSTNPTIGNLAMWSSTGSSASTATLHSVATSSLSGGGPITVSNSPNIIGASTATLGCTNASVSVTGCLLASDFSKFNSATTTFSFPLTYTGSTNAVTWYGLSSTSALTAGQVIYSSGTNGVQSVATGTVSAGSSAITVTAGRSVLFGALAIDCAVASASQAGCISSASFSKHDSATTTFSSPLTYTSGTNAVTCPTCLTSNGADPFSHPFPWTSASTSSFMFGTTTISTNVSSTLTLSSSTAPQLSLFGGGGWNGWAFRNTSGNFSLSSTTIDGLGTSTTQAFTIASSSLKIGVGSTTPFAEVSIDTSQNLNGPALSIGSSAGIGALFSTSTFASFYLGTSTDPGATLTAPGTLVIATTTTAQISLVGNPTDNIWNMVSIGGSLAFATSSSLTQATSSVTAFRINNNGAVFMASTLIQAGAATDYWCYDANAQLIRVSALCTTSARRYKKDIVNLPLGLSDLLQMQPVEYLRKDPLDNMDSHLQMGFIADDVAKISPLMNETLVTYVDGNTSGTVQGFRYDQFTSLITKAIQDFYKEFQSLVARVSGLEKRLNDQQKEIDSLQVQINALKK